MFQCEGVWLPDGENHLQGMLKLGPKIDGVGTYQYRKYEAAMAFVKERRLAIDIGAHVGLWATHLTKDFRIVHCFEPILQHRECFISNLKRANYILHPVAVGAEPGFVNFRLNNSSSGDTWVDPENKTRGSIEQVTLDSYLEGIEEVDFIKLDCEGYELFALQGAEQIIRRNKPIIIVEQKPGRAEKYALARTQAVTYLQGLGMNLKREISGDFILAWD